MPATAVDCRNPACSHVLRPLGGTVRRVDRHGGCATPPASPSRSAAAAQQFGQRRNDRRPQVIRLPVVEGTDLRFTRCPERRACRKRAVTQIVQDDRGFMWFGTQFGLDRLRRFIGSRCSNTRPATPRVSAVSTFTRCFKDRSGNLWVGCHQYLDRFDPQTETFVHYQFDAAAKEGPCWLRGPYQPRQ